MSIRTKMMHMFMIMTLATIIIVWNPQKIQSRKINKFMAI